MPFASLNDPVDVARASAALDVAWQRVMPSIPCQEHDHERGRLASIVADTVYVAIDEADLVERSVRRFLKSRASGGPPRFGEL